MRLRCLFLSFALLCTPVCAMAEGGSGADAEKAADQPAEVQPEPEAPPMRPVKYASAEINPLAMLVGLFGGQVEVGVAGRVAVVASPSYLSFGNGFNCSEVDGCSGGPAAHGFVLEVGPRVFLPIEKRKPNRSPVYAWIEPAWGHDWIQIEATSKSAGNESIFVARESVRRNRFILDLGVHVPIGQTPLYAVGGLGYSQVL